MLVNGSEIQTPWEGNAGIKNSIYDILCLPPRAGAGGRGRARAGAGGRGRARAGAGGRGRARAGAGGRGRGRARAGAGGRGRARAGAGGRGRARAGAGGGGRGRAGAGGAGAGGGRAGRAGAGGGGRGRAGAGGGGRGRAGAGGGGRGRAGGGRGRAGAGGGGRGRAGAGGAGGGGRGRAGAGGGGRGRAGAGGGGRGAGGGGRGRAGAGGGGRGRAGAGGGGRGRAGAGGGGRGGRAGGRGRAGAGGGGRFDVDERTYLDLVGEKPSASTSTMLTDLKLPVLMRLANKEEFTYSGVVDFVDNRLNGNTGTIRMRGVFANPQHILKAGLFVRVRLPLGNPYKTLLIPDESLQSDQGKKYLFVVDGDSKVEYRTVTLGQSIQGLRVIKGGLKDGEKVIINGMQRVRSGQKVKAIEQPPPKQPDSPLKKLLALKQSKNEDAPPQADKAVPVSAAAQRQQAPR